MAYAGALFVDKLLNALVLNKTVTACSYVESPIAKALLGKKVGEVVDVESPNGVYQIEITSIA